MLAIVIVKKLMLSFKQKHLFWGPLSPKVLKNIKNNLSVTACKILFLLSLLCGPTTLAQKQLNWFFSNLQKNRVLGQNRSTKSYFNKLCTVPSKSCRLAIFPCTLKPDFEQFSQRATHWNNNNLCNCFSVTPFFNLLLNISIRNTLRYDISVGSRCGAMPPPTPKEQNLT